MQRQQRFGHNGTGRRIGGSGGKKVSRGEITAAYTVDIMQLAKNQAAFDSADKYTITQRPSDFRLLEGEMAFRVRGGGDRVMTVLNGLEAPLVEVFPNEPDVVRDLLSMLVQPIGVVREDARTDLDQPQVTLRVGGTCPAGSPGVFNVPGQANARITAGCAVVFDVPSLGDPIQHGTRAGGRGENKVLLVARAADKRSTARRIQNVLGQIVHDPGRFQRALREHSRVATAWTKVAMRAVRSFKVSLLMALDLLLKQNIIQIVGAAPPAVPPPAVTELLGDANAALSSEDTVARLAELISVLDPRAVYGSLTPAQRAKWKELDFNLKQRMIPVPDPRSNAYNAANEFGFRRDPDTGTWTSKARVGQSGEPKRDAIGKLLGHSLTHLPQLLEAFTEANFDERRMQMGIALTSPSNADDGWFDLQLIPHGGLSEIQ